VPNRKIVGEILHNYGQIRQLNLSVSIGRAQDVEGALAAVQAVVNGNANVLKEPAPVIGVTKLGSGTITIAVAPWVKVADYPSAGGDINRAIVERFAAGGIQYPVPPLEVVRMAAGAQAVH
jgi:small conductance mechanosensitive channel